MYLKRMKDGELEMLFDSPVMQENCIQITKAEYETLSEELDILANGTYSYRGMIAKQEKFRDFRSRQFAAFDIYKSNIDYGIIEEDETTRENIISWYLLMLEFPEYITEDNYESIIFPETPEAVRMYVEGVLESEPNLSKAASELRKSGLRKLNYTEV